MGSCLCRLAIKAVIFREGVLVSSHCFCKRNNSVSWAQARTQQYASQGELSFLGWSITRSLVFCNMLCFLCSFLRTHNSEVVWDHFWETRRVVLNKEDVKEGKVSQILADDQWTIIKIKARVFWWETSGTAVVQNTSQMMNASKSYILIFNKQS